MHWLPWLLRWSSFRKINKKIGEGGRQEKEMTGPLSKTVPPDTFLPSSYYWWHKCPRRLCPKSLLPKKTKRNINIAHTADVKQKSKEVLEETSGRTVNGTSSVFRMEITVSSFPVLTSFSESLLLLLLLLVLLQILKFNSKNKVHNQPIWFFISRG